MSTEKRNMELMQTLDDAWNAQDGDAFAKRHKTFFASGDWTCSIARFHGTMTGPMVMGGTTIPPNGKKFEVDLCTVARWHDGQIVEANLFYDVVGMMSQLGLDG